MKATIKRISLENFKGVKSATYQFGGKNVSVIGTKPGECNGKSY